MIASACSNSSLESALSDANERQVAEHDALEVRFPDLPKARVMEGLEAEIGRQKAPVKLDPRFTMPLRLDPIGLGDGREARHGCDGASC